MFTFSSFCVIVLLHSYSPYNLVLVNKLISYISYVLLFYFSPLKSRHSILLFIKYSFNKIFPLLLSYFPIISISAKDRSVKNLFISSFFTFFDITLNTPYFLPSNLLHNYYLGIKWYIPFNIMYLIFFFYFSTCFL